MRSDGDPAYRADGAIARWISPADDAEHGGDWCEIVAFGERTVALTIGDVSGHGEAAAGTMAIVRDAVLDALTQSRVPSAILAIANDIAYGIGEGVIVTAIVAVVDYEHQTITFANAGHPPPLLSVGDVQAFLTHAPADLPLGIFPRHTAADYVVELPNDALLVFYTDGITEHDRDPIRGESELAGAARWVYDRHDDDAARAVAEHVFQFGRGDDDAAALTIRLIEG
jgi:serine phosphatase RsbU (regulator of sigma subunit)